MDIQKYKFEAKHLPETLLCDDKIDAKSTTSIKCSGYWVVFQTSDFEICAMNLTNTGHELRYQSEKKITSFAVHDKTIVLAVEFAIIILLIENTLSKQGEQPMPHIVHLQIIDDIGILAYSHHDIYLVDGNHHLVLQQKIKQVQYSQSHQCFFILTSDGIKITNQNLQLLNELSLSKKETIQLVLFEKLEKYLITLRQDMSLVLWQFSSTDLHSCTLVPIQSIKLTNDAQGEILMDIDPLEDILYIYYLKGNSIITWFLLLNTNIQDQSFVQTVRVLQIQDVNSLNLHLIPICPMLQDQFLKSNNQQSQEQIKSIYSEFLKEKPVLDEISEILYLCLAQNDGKLQLYWFYVDRFFHGEQDIVFQGTKKIINQGSKSLPPASLPPMPEQKEIKEVKVETDPLKQALEILAKDLIPPLQHRNDIQVVCSEIRNELLDDPSFMFAIKDLIEDQIKKENDKPSQEQQLKQDLAQLEFNMEKVINQNLEQFTLTCETFIQNSFSKEYFESLIDKKVQENIQKFQISQSSINKEIDQQFNQHIVPLYASELQQLSKGVITLFEKVQQCITDIQYQEGVKVNNFNITMDSVQQQLSKITLNIVKLIENYKPSSDLVHKIENAISVIEHKHQGGAQQQPHLDERLNKIEDLLSSLSIQPPVLQQQHSFQPVITKQDTGFQKQIIGQLTQLQLKLIQPGVNVADILNQLILQFQLFLTNS